MSKRFAGQFDTLTKLGSDYENGERFKPLKGEGKPLWEFKEHGHRLYCYRQPFQNKSLQVILLSGWSKQKKGRTDKEDREIEHAIRLFEECMENSGGIR